jgi:uncharacterized membrane protein
MYNSKPAVKSLGVTAPIIAILVIALGAFGVDISGDVAGLPDKIAGVIDSVIAIIAIAVGIWGRVRAKVEIKGIIQDK